MLLTLLFLGLGVSQRLQSLPLVFLMILNKYQPIYSENGATKPLPRELTSFQNLDSDSELSITELSSLAIVEKKQSIFWKNILNARENHMIKWSKKSRSL